MSNFWFDGVSTATLEETILAQEKIQEAIDLLFPPLYYGVNKNIEKWVFYFCKETNINPECIVCHPDDLEILKEKINNRRFVDIKDEPKEKVLNRIIGNIKNMDGYYTNEKSTT